MDTDSISNTTERRDAVVSPSPDATDETRGPVYALLSNLFAEPPDAVLLSRLASIEIGPLHAGRMVPAWRGLRKAAAEAEADQVNDEFHELFIGIAHGEVLPYASWYLSGRLMDWPLTNLRGDLKQLGIQGQAGLGEPEDHVAALCEVMCLLGEDDTMSGVERQHAFLTTHMLPWLPQFFQELDRAPSADFYRAVAEFGRAFFELEREYLELTLTLIKEEGKQ
jgi:TorA maturation chaperone TorD